MLVKQSVEVNYSHFFENYLHYILLQFYNFTYQILLQFSESDSPGKNILYFYYNIFIYYNILYNYIKLYKNIYNFI